VEELLALRDKKEFQEASEEMWPPRTKTDLALRRTRLLDFVICARENGRVDDVRYVMTASREGWDIIFVTNLVVATLTFGMDWFRRWQWLGAFDADLAHYIAVAKKVNDLGKTVGIIDDNWTWFVECAVMGGYRNPPFPGFDVVEEAKALADGGEEHNYFGWNWRDLCREFLPMSYRHVKFKTFRQFVIDGDWITGGASSVGRLHLTGPDGKTYNIKARKNMVPDVIELEKLADDAEAATSQENFTIVKSELGKLRLAVAGDIYTYLKMTWVNELLGGAYYDWPGNTSEEDFEQQTLRLERTLELCARGYGLPYDYAGFDHQPQTDELLGIVDRLCEHAALNVPPSERPAFDRLVGSIKFGFRSATLETRVPGEDNVKLPVTGGLMSGLRWTSTVGNAWNSVMTGLAMKLLTSWGISTDQIERFIRGDDSAIFTPNWATGAAVNLAYDAIGAKGGEGKFSLQHGQMEFLRVWFNTRCWGYPARALPGLTQRKPWSNQPWSEDMVLKALYDTCRTLTRRAESRAADISALWRTLRRVWCRNHSLPVQVTVAPAARGGYGIEPPTIGESWSIVPPVPRATAIDSLTVNNQTTWRATKLREYALERYDLVVSEEDAARIARAELLSTVNADNVPDIARVVRREWLDQVRTTGCRALLEKTPVVAPIPRVDLNSYRPSQVKMVKQRLRAEAPLFGAHPEVATARSDYDRLRPPGTLRDWLRNHYPAAYCALNQFHRSWFRSEALDYLEGSIAIPMTKLHPALTGIAAGLVAATFQPKSRARRNTVAWSAAILEDFVYHSPISQRTYRW
jgi:hypothetical protein